MKGEVITSTLKKGDIVFCTNGFLEGCYLECACDSFLTNNDSGKVFEFVKSCEYNVMLYVDDLLKVKRSKL